MSDKITCQICGAAVHSVQLHLRDEHPDTVIDDYKALYPDAPLLSEVAKERLAKRKSSEEETKTRAASVVDMAERTGGRREPLHELFDLGRAKAARNAKGEPILIRKLAVDESSSDLVPEVDENLVWDIETLKSAMLAIEKNMPLLLWGHAGTGKTSIARQICARTNRAFMRVQHTANTEEAHIIGQMLANEKGTYFEPGPLALAMKHGWLYCADEYDFADPSVTAVYQPVLEGEPLVIKEATPEWRVIRPHPEFRFVATGNTNGAGDETGLYGGTVLGNAANYSRFGVTLKVNYMPKAQEIAMLRARCGLTKEDSNKIVDFAMRVREQFDAGKLSVTIGPRELINASTIGLLRADFRIGLRQAYINRLGGSDFEAVDQIAQRLFD